MVQEWLCMVTQHVFGSKGGIFRQCSHDPATVHPLSFSARPQGTSPHAARQIMNLAGRLAGEQPPPPLCSPRTPQTSPFFPHCHHSSYIAHLHTRVIVYATRQGTYLSPSTTFTKEYLHLFTNLCCHMLRRCVAVMLTAVICKLFPQHTVVASGLHSALKRSCRL